MKKIIKKAFAVTMAIAVTAGSLSCMPKTADAENPIIQTTYTADPSPFVIGDTLYLITTRDELKEQKYDDWSYMNEWRCYSTKDMINFTDLGQIAHAETFDRESSNKENWRAWAPQVVMRPIKQENGEWQDKYFLFAPFNGTKIDVAVADNPWGPYEDATPGKYLIDGGWGGGNIDPTVYIEDHGHPEDKDNYDAYLYWGNPYFRYCKLTDDMLDVDPDTDGDGVISDEESVIDPRFEKSDNKILGEVRPGLHSFQTFDEEGYESFGIPTQGKDNTDKDKDKFPAEPEGTSKKRSAFEEGPWVMKHEDGNPDTDDYFLIFVGGRTPGETIEYSTAPTPVGPWTYRGLLLAREHGFSCLHPGAVEYKGHHYLFYLNQMLIGGDGSNRSVCVLEYEYDEDNLIVKQTPDGVDALMVQGMDTVNGRPVQGTSYFSVDPIGSLNPYELNQAETICWESNLGGAAGGFNGTGRGVKTKAKAQCTDIDDATGREAFWKSAALNGVVVCDIDNEDFIKVREVDFGSEGAVAFKASIACGQGTPLENPVVDSNGMEIFNPEAGTVGGTMEIWTDYEDESARKLIGTVEVGDTGGTNEYQEFSIDIKESPIGVHDLYFIFKGEDNEKLFNFDTWQFEGKYKAPDITATATPEPTLVPGITAAPAATVAVQPVIPETPSVQAVKLDKPKFKKCAVKGGKVSVSLTKVKNAGGYQIYVSDKKKGKYKLVLKLKASKPSGVIKSLKKKRTYYIKARAYCNADGQTIYSGYSSIKKVNIK